MLHKQEAALASADVVLGPAEDGGYVLIGCSRAVPEIFREIEWGTNRVLEQNPEIGFPGSAQGVSA